MKLFFSPRNAVVLTFLSTLSLTTAAPYVDWMNDYTGNEANTSFLWKFDTATGVTTDSSGNGVNTGIATTGTSTGDPGKFGEAFYSGPDRSSANNSYAQGNSASETAFNASALSVEFWYKPLSDTITTTTLSYFFDKKFDKPVGLLLRLNNVGTNSQRLEFSVGNGTSSKGLMTEDLTWDPSQWYHIAVTYENLEGDGYLKIFRNGELLAQDTALGFGDLSFEHVQRIEIDPETEEETPVMGTYRFRLANRLGSSYGSAPGYYDNLRVSSVAYEYSMPIPEPGIALLGALGLATLFTRRRG